MAHKETSTGRPRFPIDPMRLRQLREEAGLTQLALAKRVYALLGKGAASEAGMKTSCQRWEKRGRTTPETQLENAPSKTGKPSGGGRGNNPSRK